MVERFYWWHPKGFFVYQLILYFAAVATINRILFFLHYQIINHSQIAHFKVFIFFDYHSPLIISIKVRFVIKEVFLKVEFYLSV